jgi:starch synthase
MRILFAASECVPFVKTGGLADVIGALPKEIRRSGEDVRVILPLYQQIDKKWRDQMEHVVFFYINLGWRRQYVGIEKLTYEGITFYFVDNKQYFQRSYVYGLGGDEGERYTFFSRAVLEALPQMGFVPDILHCHDWQTGLMPILLNAQYRQLEHYKDIKTVFTIHNLQYQGIFSIGEIEELVALGEWAYSADNLEFYGMCSFMKGGIVAADRITTVSPTYAEEIKTAYYGERLDGLLRARADHLTGILNGIDTGEYDPFTDKALAQNYSADDFLAGKAACKAALQKEMGLAVDPNVPLIGMVGRLSGQKGLDLVERVLSDMMGTGVQIAVLGMGESKYVDLFSWAQWKYPGKVAASFQMNHDLARRIYAGADMFLMPSMFEPCGLSQLISLRYGTLPVVRETGGLRDTVLAYNDFTGEGNGFTFLNYNAHDMLHVVERAVKVFREHKADVWDVLAKRAMGGQYGWDQSAHHYVDLYRALCAPAQPAPAAQAEAEPKPAQQPTAAEPAKEEPPKPAKKPGVKKADEKPAAEVKAKAPAKKATAKKAPVADAKPEAAPKKPRAPRKKADA